MSESEFERFDPEFFNSIGRFEPLSFRILLRPSGTFVINFEQFEPKFSTLPLQNWLSL